MNTQLLIQMLELAYNNKPSKALNDLCLQIAVDPELGDIVNLSDFSNEFYSARSITYIRKCIDFKLL